MRGSTAQFASVLVNIENVFRYVHSNTRRTAPQFVEQVTLPNKMESYFIRTIPNQAQTNVDAIAVFSENGLLIGRQRMGGFVSECYRLVMRDEPDYVYPVQAEYRETDTPLVLRDLTERWSPSKIAYVLHDLNQREFSRMHA